MGIRDIFSKKIAEKQVKQQTAAEAYRDLLHSHAASADDKWSKEDEDRLLALCSELNITHEQAIKDYEIVAKMTEEAQMFATVEAKKLAHTKAYEAQQKAHADYKVQLAAAQERSRIANLAHDQSWNDLTHAEKAQHRLNELSKQYPHLGK